jgi:hypothetical protein
LPAHGIKAGPLIEKSASAGCIVSTPSIGHSLPLLVFHMFAGGYGNRIKCRIVHHDPVLGLGIRFDMSPSRNHVARGAPLLSPECHNGARKPSYPLVRRI